MTTKLAIDGMHCDGCVRRVKKILERAGAKNVTEVTIGSATLDASAEEVGALVEQLGKEGYPARVA